MSDSFECKPEASNVSEICASSDKRKPKDYDLFEIRVGQMDDGKCCRVFVLTRKELQSQKNTLLAKCAEKRNYCLNILHYPNECPELFQHLIEIYQRDEALMFQYVSIYDWTKNYRLLDLYKRFGIIDIDLNEYAWECKRKMDAIDQGKKCTLENIFLD